MIHDTSPKIQAVYDRMIMTMTGEQRLRMALEISQLTHGLAKQGIKDQHPDWSETQVQREFLRSLFAPGTKPSGL